MDIETIAALVLAANAFLQTLLPDPAPEHPLYWPSRISNALALNIGRAANRGGDSV